MNTYDPLWFTHQLHTAGALTQGTVTAVDVGSNLFTGATGTITRLALTYSPDALGERPYRLCLKQTMSDPHPEILAAAQREVDFYSALTPYAAASAATFPVPTCYGAEIDVASGRCSILMADLSESHFQKPSPIQPSPRHSQLIIESLGHHHAYWWGHLQLGRSIGQPYDAAKSHAGLERLYASVPAFMDYLGDSLVPEQRAIYEQILASGILERYDRRYREMDRVTLNHGDCHAGNFMLPHDIDAGKAMIIDWQLWGIGVAANDLAYMMAHGWSAQRRAALEEPLLHHYHRQLLRHGVTDYSWDELWQDYRESAAISVLIPIGQVRRGQRPGVIWIGMEYSMAAFLDLACAEVL